MQAGPKITTPLLGGSVNINSTGTINFNITTPQLNFPIGAGANGYIMLKW